MRERKILKAIPRMTLRILSTGTSMPIFTALALFYLDFCSVLDLKKKKSGFVSGFSNNFGFGLDLDPDPGYGSKLLMNNTLEFTLFFLKAEQIFHPHLSRRSSGLRKKANFFKSTFLLLCIFQLETELDLDPDPDPEFIPDPNLQLISDPYPQHWIYAPFAYISPFSFAFFLHLVSFFHLSFMF